MDEEYLVDVDKQPIRNAIFRTLAGLLCAGFLFVLWSEGVQIYEAGWTHFDIASYLKALIHVHVTIVMGLFAIGGYDALLTLHRFIDDRLQRLLDPNYKADARSMYPSVQLYCPRKRKYRRLFYAARGLRPWR